MPRPSTQRRAGLVELPEDDSPTPEQIQEFHALEPLPAVALAQAESPGPLKRWRVALKGCRVRTEDPARGVAVYMEYLDVDAADPFGALVAFARYNGIPMVRDPLTGETKLASIHRPEVVSLPAVPVQGVTHGA